MRMKLFFTISGYANFILHAYAMGVGRTWLSICSNNTISAFPLPNASDAILHYLPAKSVLFSLLIIVNNIFRFKHPEDFSHRNSRFWFLKHCFNCFTAPFHFVTFSDFWLGDQMNSLA